ncbi:hypothetical protein EG329_004538 [Mollisiaceae sp. DMI_Dod_QoI]|nr:hypothetical protein EG329_004538 [Helotiales sp. DMI_Dod_QoI]
MLDQRILRLLPFSACILTLLVLGFSLYGPDVHSVHVADLVDLVPWWSSSSSSEDVAPLDPIPDPNDDSHPIIELLRKADEEFNAFLDKETFDLPAAAKRYRERRGRHPPPGFDKWWQYAKDNNATIVEDFWDQIYHDLNPLWALNPKDMLDNVRAQPRLFKLRNGKVTHESDHFWMPIWQDLINDVAEDLPDMDLSMNTMDEPRLFIPWEDMAGYMEKEKKSRKLVDHNQVNDKFSAFNEAAPDFVPPEYPWDGSQPIWPRAASACPPDSPARQAPLQTDFSQPPNLTTTYTSEHTTAGYVSNYTLSTSLCHQPDIQGLHGFFIESISTSTGPKLFPLFGSSKLLQNSEILVPPAMYYKGDDRFTITAPAVPWSQKTSSLVWRGLASGGRNKESNWKGFHRHRLVSMLNGTQALLMPNSSNFIDIESLPLEHFHLQSLEQSSLPPNEALGHWLNQFADVGLNDLACFPREAPPPNGLTCYYTSYLFSPSSHVTLEEQHHHKYLVDVDGNSFSGRYRDFLSSGSMPIKATLFREWHDSRLVPWKHFVPMDNRFLDIYGIMEFFLGYEDPAPVDAIDTSSSSHVDLEHEAEAAEFELHLPPNTAEARRRRRHLTKSQSQSQSEIKPRREKRAPDTETQLNAIFPNGRDYLAKKIALDGRDWAAKVLRIEDMRVYTYRLLLEYARVMDESREKLGWIDDLAGLW